MEEDYFSIADVLCDEQRVKVKFLENVKWSSSLDMSATDDNLSTDGIVAKGTILQIPLWMARALVESNTVLILPPRQFNTRVRSDLAADPSSVNIKDLSSHWYLLGAKLSPLIPTEGVARTMRIALTGRLPLLSKSIFTPSNTMSEDPHKSVFGGTQGLTSTLDYTELSIYSATVAGRKDANAWSSRTNQQLLPLDIFNN